MRYLLSLMLVSIIFMCESACKTGRAHRTQFGSLPESKQVGEPQIIDLPAGQMFVRVEGVSVLPDGFYVYTADRDPVVPARRTFVYRFRAGMKDNQWKPFRIFVEH